MIWLPRRNAWSCRVVVVVVVEVERLVGGDLSLPEHHQNQLRRLVQKNSNSLLYQNNELFYLDKRLSSDLLPGSQTCWSLLWQEFLRSLRSAWCPRQSSGVSCCCWWRTGRPGTWRAVSTAPSGQALRTPPLSHRAEKYFNNIFINNHLIVTSLLKVLTLSWFS